MPRPPEQPTGTTEQEIMLGWLAYHRAYFRRKCHGLTPEQLATRSVEPSALSLLGLLRHLCEMEHVCVGWPLNGPDELTWVWGEYADGAEDDFDCAPGDAPVSWDAWERLQRESDAALAAHPDWDEPLPRIGGKPVRWCVAKLVGEYAQHNGHADLVRERLDGQREQA